MPPESSPGSKEGGKERMVGSRNHSSATGTFPTEKEKEPLVFICRDCERLVSIQSSASFSRSLLDAVLHL